ncbi:4'-phosphopantetheinyl transferase superfamily protein [Pedobacter hartonius]|uniref:4'-phosphopantetheinyl transferase superfamily protein n=1 Tax=Pedobacter hartonius TaxID=425514 RepID=A0A1H3WE90_9SPHI|nr:4'-phosphopantetheinyl transferase superfamily protein [Pedobacter hartonius]
MIGNDLVDLRQAATESNWQRKGYLGKIYTPEEQELILNAAEPSVMVWLLWTMKEAGYKVLNRITAIRSYSPQSFICCGLITNGSQATAVVCHDERRIYIKSEISSQMIHSTATLNKQDLEELTLSYMDNSADYRADFNRSSRGYFLTKTSSGLPLIIHGPTGRKLIASVSHHGKYAAIVYSDSLLSAG